MKIKTSLALLALSMGLCSAAMAQRVIRIVVPFGPGAVQDTVARTFSNELGQILGATVVVENRAGAGGTIGTAAVVHAGFVDALHDLQQARIYFMAGP